MHDATKDVVAPVCQDAVEVCMEAGKRAGINELMADGLAAPGETCVLVGRCALTA